MPEAISAVPAASASQGLRRRGEGRWEWERWFADTILGGVEGTQRSRYRTNSGADGVPVGLPRSQDPDVVVQDQQFDRQGDREQEQEDGQGGGHAAAIVASVRRR